MDEYKVFIVREGDQILKIFTNLESAQTFLKKTVDEFIETILTSRWHIKTEIDDLSAKITAFQWILNIFYYQSQLKNFSIECHSVFD